MKVSPAVRQLADQHGLDLTQVVGTGPGGRIIRKDIEPLIASATSPAQLTRTQSLIARRMVQARQTVPEFAISVEVDMEPAWAARNGIKAGRPAVVPSLNDMVIKVTPWRCGRTPRRASATISAGAAS